MKKEISKEEGRPKFFIEIIIIIVILIVSIAFGISEIQSSMIKEHNIKCQELGYDRWEGRKFDNAYCINTSNGIITEQARVSDEFYKSVSREESKKKLKEVVNK